MISIIHPSRGRAEKSANTIHKWINSATNIHSIELLVSCDMDDPMLDDYDSIYTPSIFRENPVIANENESAVDAINFAARKAHGYVLIVVSDDTDCFPGWDAEILKQTEGKTDWILKTQDGIQNYIITNPIMDRAYYNRTGYIYHPDFKHLFCDTYLTCVADITGRKITSNLMFKHDHYSVNGTQPDELHKRNDATWKQGEETFIRLMKEFTPEERAKISDPSMKNWLRNKGVR